MTKSAPEPESITIERNGKTYDGHYRVERGMISVSSIYGSKVTQTGGHAQAPAVLARLLLGEIVDQSGE
jgi:hypothetical protein